MVALLDWYCAPAGTGPQMTPQVHVFEARVKDASRPAFRGDVRPDNAIHRPVCNACKRQSHGLRRRQCGCKTRRPVAPRIPEMQSTRGTKALSRPPPHPFSPPSLRATRRRRSNGRCLRFPNRFPRAGRFSPLGMLANASP